MSVLRTTAMSRRPLQSHALFVGLWALLLVAATYLHNSANWPWILGAGLLPALAGLIVFLAWRKGGAVRWSVLVTGEALGVILGSLLLSGPASPLVILALWPIIWVTMELPMQAGLGVVTAMGFVYVGTSLAQALGSRQFDLAPLATVLYVGTFYGVFFLLHSLETTSTTAKPAPQQEVAPSRAPRPEMLTSPAPVDEDILHQDLRVARDIQVSLLLASSPRLPGWEASTSFLPARELGGDLYDFVELDPTHWGIMIGDVSGKGIPAALHMAVARTLFRMEARQNSGPAQTLTYVNHSLIEQAPQGCVTLLYAHIDTAAGALRLANAGHNYPFILDQTARELPLDGLPLGIDEEYVFNETTAQLMPGDVLVFYTDGVVEAMNEHGQLFGFERLQDLLKETTVRRPRSLTRQIVRTVRAFAGATPQSDDITLVVLRRRYQDRIREMSEVALDVLGAEGSEVVREHLVQMGLSTGAPADAWRAAILTLGGSVRDRLGQGPSRELMQQLFLTLESF